MEATLPAPALEPIPPQYGEFATCPITGLQIPKTPASNLAWRKTLLSKAKLSGSVRRQLVTASSSSSIFWLNAFGWTFLQKKIGGDGHEAAVFGDLSHIPFITWKVQDEAIQEIHDCIDGGHDALIQKSRDMGASWLIVALFQWYWQFRPSTTFLELSRKQSLVDRRGDMDSLFEKHRYMLRWQPEWLRPRRMKDTLLHLENLDSGSTIEGESTNENAGQASRKTAILLDEFARVANGDEIDLATADTSSCRIFNSTPSGPNTQFTRIYRAKRARIITLPWWRHPDKGRDVRQTVGDDGKPKWTSPWYDDQKTRRSKRNVAQNIDMEHGRAGDVFFDTDEIEKHRSLFQRDPVAVGSVVTDEDLLPDAKLKIIAKRLHDSMVWVPGDRKPWRLWVPLVENRPNQTTQYVFAVDISNGSGASNSVITVADHVSNMIVGKFWDAFTSPEELAEIAALSAIWFGGVRPPLIIFEKNGPGVIFGKKLLKLGYPNIYYQQVDNVRTPKATPRWGWQSSTSRKEMVLGEYREALKNATIINPCREALDEALDYVYDDAGKIEPGSVGVEEGGGQALHGDHVIADALIGVARATLPKTIVPEPTRTPPGTYAARRKAYEKSKRDRDAWSR